jgi:hypothetical protein
VAVAVKFYAVNHWVCLFVGVGFSKLPHNGWWGEFCLAFALLFSARFYVGYANFSTSAMLKYVDLLWMWRCIEKSYFNHITAMERQRLCLP